MTPEGNTFVVYGPQGCGKTRNAATLARHFGCADVQNDWDGRAPVRPGALMLTNLDRSDIEASGAQVVAYDEAMRAAGLNR